MTTPPPESCRCQHEPQGSRRWTMVVAGAVLVAVTAALAVAAWAVLRVDPWGDDPAALSERFVFDAADYQQADPALIAFRELGTFPIEFTAPRGLAVGPEERIYVAGDAMVRVFAADGQPVAEIPVKGEPSCLGLGAAGEGQAWRLYVGVGQRILVFDAQGGAIGSWTDGLNDQSVLTSLAVAEDAVFAADAGNRVVLRFDLGGALRGRIGEVDAARGVRGFVIPSAHFDVAVTADGLVRIANPGARRIETFTPDGDFLGQWGQASINIEGFFGCCNPADFSVLPDGRFVTAEKGIPRIKIYSPHGKFECVVADSQMLGQTLQGTPLDQDTGHLPTFDVAVDGDGRVLALDSIRRQVRVFVRKTS